MAPPSFGPPGYSIPQRYMNRTPPPDGADTNTRPYIIFFSYLLTCFSVSVFIIFKILQRHTVLKKSTTARQPTTRDVYLFAALAASSLITTWGFMIKYFSVSYKTWLMWRSYYELDPHQKHWGLWLRETSLFHEAWELVVVGNARYWWSHQIFFFALGLGLYLEQKGVRRGIKYTWAFMLLGQIVAISFATNLFLLTLLLSPPPSPSRSLFTTHRPRWLRPWLLNLGAILATSIPALLLADEHYWHHSSDFMPVLLTPHVALLVLPFLRAVVPDNYVSEGDAASTDRIYKYLWALTLGNAGFMMLKTTYTAWSYGGFEGIGSALLEHPAVSSVGFDVVFCWVTWICWLRTQQQDVGRVAQERIDDAKVVLASDSAGTAMTSTGFESGVRQR